jgi:hypothetical protein
MNTAQRTGAVYRERDIVAGEGMRMAIAHELKPPPNPHGGPLPVTYVLSGVAVVQKRDSLIPRWRTFASVAEAQAYLAAEVQALLQRGFTLVGPREVADEVPHVKVGRDLTIAFDAETRRMIAYFERPDQPPPEGTFATLRACLRRREPRSLHVATEGDWQGLELAQALVPSLEAFIFDWQTAARQARCLVGDIAQILAACPSLTHACVSGGSSLSATRHESLRELHLMGAPLHPSILPALAASDFPVLETLGLSQEDWSHLSTDEVVQVLGAIRAPQLAEVRLSGVSTLEVMDAVGAAAPPWTLIVVDVNFDFVEETLGILERRPALRGKLKLASGALFADEVNQLAAAGVAATADWRGLIPPNVYRSW